MSVASDGYSNPLVRGQRPPRPTGHQTRVFSPIDGTQGKQFELRRTSPPPHLPAPPVLAWGVRPVLGVGFSPIYVTVTLRLLTFGLESTPLNPPQPPPIAQSAECALRAALPSAGSFESRRLQATRDRLSAQSRHARRIIATNKRISSPFRSTKLKISSTSRWRSLPTHVRRRTETSKPTLLKFE
jgi:hypothetical protein